MELKLEKWRPVKPNKYACPFDGGFHLWFHSEDGQHNLCGKCRAHEWHDGKKWQITTEAACGRCSKGEDEHD